MKHIGEDKRACDISRLCTTGILYLDGYWQSERYFAAQQAIIREDLAFREPPGALNQPVLHRINATNSVCVHVRRGDYVRVPENRSIYACLEPEYYRKALEYVRGHVPDPHVFLFSDDPAEARKVIDTDFPVTIVDHNGASDDHEDLRLMSHCKYFVIANSSFSWWGAWLARHLQKIVVAPKTWFVDDKHASTDKALIPESWIRL